MDLNTFFSDEDKQKINAAVTEAEKSTSAEIVPVLTDASGDYDRAEDMFGILLAIISVAVLWVCCQGVDASAPWATPGAPGLTYNLLLVVITIVVAFAVGAIIASKVWFIRHLFAPTAFKRDCVKRGARRAFHEHNLSKTADATGILIYISAFERMVYVLGDETISEKLWDDDFVAVKDAIIDGFKQGQRAEGLCKGIRLCGDKLTEHFPIKEGDVNELPNDLRIYQQDL